VNFSITSGNFTPLINHLLTIDYDGGTSLLYGFPFVSYNNDSYLLFSDGLVTVSEEISDNLVVPIYVISSSEQANHTYLKILARKSGGEYIKLSTDSSKSFVAPFGSKTFKFLSATFDKSLISMVYPSIPSSITHSTFILAGKIKNKTNKIETTIQLNYGYGSQITHQVQYHIYHQHLDILDQSGIVPRLWAQRYVDQLLLFPGIENKAKILEIGRKYGIVTSDTSFIVLENLDQYINYEIVPPETLPSIREQYFLIISENKSQETQVREEKIHQVLDLWKSVVE